LQTEQLYVGMQCDHSARMHARFASTFQHTNCPQMT